MSKKIIDFRKEDYEKTKTRENRIISLFDTLKKIAENALGPDNVDMSKMLTGDAKDYLINSYDNLHLTDWADHLDRRELFVRHTKTDLLQVATLQNEYNKLERIMGTHKPIVTGQDITGNIQRDDFNVYLNDSKAEHYEALENLLKAIGDVSVFTQLGSTLNLMRSFKDFRMSGDASVNNGVEINPELFK